MTGKFECGDQVLEYSEEMDVEIIRLEPQRSFGPNDYDEEISWDKFFQNLDHMYPPKFQEIRQHKERIFKGHLNRRWVIKAYNEGGYNSTQVDLIQLLKFIKDKLPEIWDKIDELD